MTTTKTYGWGYMLNVNRDRGRLAHLLRADGSPACGARYFASAGQSEDVQTINKCLHCLKIEKASS